MRYIAGFLTLLWGLVLAAGMVSAQSANDYLVTQACTSQDVQPTVGAVTVIDICDGSPGDTVTIDFGLTLNNNTNTERYDILFGFSDGIDPISGDAHIVTSSCAQQIPGSNSGNLFDSDGQGDCDDLQGSASQSLTSSATFQCDALGTDATINLAPSTWWTSQSNAAAINDGTTLIDGPKCFLDTRTVTIPLGAAIDLQKLSIGGTGTFGFTLSGTGVTGTTITTTTAGVPATSTANIRPNSYDPNANGGLGGYTQNVVISEAAPNGWSLTGISCTDNANPGVELGSFTGGGASGSYTIPASALAVNQNITCVATNDNRGTLEITKAVNDGGTGLAEAASTWNVGYSDGGTVTGSANGTISALVPAGTYDIREALAGLGYSYDAVLNCGTAQASVPVSSNGVQTTVGTATVTAGQTTSCTITNTLRTATLTVQKQVQNGGAAGTLATATDWTVAYDGPGVLDGSAAGTVGPVTVPAGAYTLSETPLSVPAGLTYTQTGFACSAGSVAGSTVTLTAGQNATCTFTNTLSTATLTLLKSVTDPAAIGGAAAADWNLTFTGPSGATRTAPTGDPLVTAVTVPAGAYSFAETPLTTPATDNYAWTDFACTGATASSFDSTTTSGSATLADGDAATCTFTNSIDKARLRITKAVVNDTAAVIPGADAWRMGYSGTDSDTALGTATTPIDVLVTPGAYAITEQLAGNTLAYDVAVNCGTAAATSVTDGTTATVSNLTLAAGEDVSCTVTNTVRSVNLTLAKVVDDGSLTVGTAAAGDWSLNYAGTVSGSVTTGAPAVRVPVGTYALTEIGNTANTGNYALQSLVCNGTDVTAAGSFDVTADTTCTFTNAANVAQVTLVKAVTDPLGAALPANQWNLAVNNGIPGTNGQPSVTNVLVAPGPITLTEDSGAHDLAYGTTLACTTGTVSHTADARTGTVTVAAGDNTTCTFTNTLQAGSIALNKAINTALPGITTSDWTLSFQPTLTSNTYTGSGAGSVAQTPVPADTYTITEVRTDTSAEAQTYALTALVCTDATGATLLDLSGTQAAPVSLPQTVAVANGQDVSCTFTNTTAAARLTLVKTVDDRAVAAGTTVPAAGAWNLTATGGTDTLSGATGTTGLVTADTYALTEALADGVLNYDATLSCTGATSFTDAGATVTGATTTTVGSVTLAAGQVVECTIDNALETAVLTLEKSVTANALGVVATGWDLTFNGPGGATGTGENTQTAITAVTVPAGSYTLTEALNTLGNADADYGLYTLDTLTCTGSDANGADGLTLVDGETVTCTFLNTANQGRLTLVKTVDDGNVAAGTTVPAATDWTLSATGATPITGVTGTGAVTYQAVTAGSYTISELLTGNTLGYDATLSCTGAAGGFVSAGATVTGAADTTVGTVTVGAGEDVTCTIDNALETATLTLVKSVPANALGVVATGWDLTFNGPGGATGTGENTQTAITAVTVPAGSYTLTEALNTSATDPDYLTYGLETLTCAGGSDANGGDGLTLADGETVTCTFLNTTNQGRLTLIKDAVNTGGAVGTFPGVNDWTLSFASTTTASTGSGVNAASAITSTLVAAGTYDISEALAGNPHAYNTAMTCTGTAAFTQNGAVVDDGTTTAVGSVTVAAGDDITCRITNTLSTATLTLVKSVDNGAFGTAAITDWTLSFDGPGASDASGASGDGTITAVTVPAGAYTLVEANGPANYTLSSLACTGGTDANGLDGLTLVEGEDVTCTFQNDIDKARVTLVKDVQNPAALNGVALAETAWDLTVNGGTAGNNGDVSVTNVLVDAGTIALSESAGGHDLSYTSSLACVGATGATVDNADRDGTGSVTVAAGDDVTCTFTNLLEAGTLTLVKSVAPNALGVTADGWNLTFDGAATSGIGATGQTGTAAVTTVTVPADTYTLTEALTGAVAGNVNYQQYGLESLVCSVNGQTGTDIKGAPQIAVGNGDAVTCTFTNSPNTAKVTLVKDLAPVPAAYQSLVTPEGDWVLAVGGNSFSSSAWAAQNVYLTPGTYALSEANGGEAFLYDAGITCTGGSVTDNRDGTGSLTLGAGDVGSDITCTFANRLETATLTLVKDVDNGAVTTGIDTAADWDLTYAGPEAVTGTDVTGGASVTSVVVPAGAFTLSETGTGANAADYAQTSLLCTGGTDANGADGLTLVDGEAVTCTFLNTLGRAQLTLAKTVVNDNGGTFAAADFTLSAGGTAFAQNTATQVAAGSYVLTETGPAGYTPTGLSCAITRADGVTVEQTGDILATPSVMLSAGEAAVCTFVNDDIAPTYDMAKSAPVAFAAVGETIAYSFEVSNAGPWAIEAISVTDPLPGLSAISCPATTLAAGASMTCTASYTVTQADVDGAGISTAVDPAACASGRGIVNTATSSATETDGTALTETDAANNTATVCLPAAGPAISVLKTIDADAAGLGETIDYAITVRNEGNVTLSLVTLNDVLTDGDGTDLSAALTLPTLVSGDDGNGLLDVGETWVYDATYVVTQSDVDSGSVTNTVSVSAFAPGDVPVTDGPSTVVTTFAQTAGISVVKTIDTDAAAVGETIDYAIAVENTGNVTLSGVTLDDLLSDGDAVDLTAALTGPTLVSGDDGNGALDVGETWVYDATYVVTQSDVDSGSVTNTVSVEATDPAGAPVTDGPSTVVTLLAPAPELTLLKAGTFRDENGDGFGQAGETILYTFTVTNTGNITLTDVTIDDPLVAVSGGPIPSLAPGESDTGTFTAIYALTQTDIENGLVRNVAIATGTDPDGDPVEDESDDPKTVEPNDPTDEVIPAQPGFSITVDVAEPEVAVNVLLDEATQGVLEILSYSPGQLTYTVTVPNTGDITLVNPVLDFTVVERGQSGAATLVGSFPITNASLGAPTSPSYPDEVVSVVRGGDTDGDGQLDVGETWTYTIVITVTDAIAAELGGLGGVLGAAGVVDGIGTFVADDVRPATGSLPPQTDDDVSAVIITFEFPETGPNDLDIAKSTPRDNVLPGEVVPWIIEVTNDGTVGFEILDVIDTLPTGFTYRDGSATVDGVSVDPVIDGSRVIFRDLRVDAGETLQIVIGTTIAGTVRPGIYVNRVFYVDDNGDRDQAEASVVVGAEPVFDCGTVIGKVFDDRNQNGYQDGPWDQPEAPVGLVYADEYGGGKYAGKGAKYVAPEPEKGEPGIPGVRLVTVKGEIITTDQYGRFSVPCAALPRSIGENFTLKLDTRSLPSGYRLTTENPRVVRLTAGKMTKMNFGATISRVVRIDVAENAFEPGTNTPRPAFVAALGRAVQQFADQPATVRISYVEKGESAAVMNRRMRSVEQVLRQYWRESGKYRLMVEKTVQRRR